MRGRLTIRNVLGLLAPTGVFQRISDSHPCILMYHCVGGGGYDNITTNLFDEHLRWLTENYEIVDVGSIRQRSGRKRVAITFDDGLLSFMDHALPVLERYDAPATLYVIGRTVSSGRTVEDDRKFINVSQLRQLDAHPLVTIGSHSMTHQRLAKLENPDEIRREISDAAAQLGEITGRKIAGFCYPYNNWNEKVREVVAATHEHAVCGMGDTELIGPRTSPWSLPRINAAVSLNRLRFAVSDTWKIYNKRTSQ